MERRRRYLSWLSKLAKLDAGRHLRPTRTRVAAGVSVLAALSLFYLLGAAAMYFRLPTSVFLTKAFAGPKTGIRRPRPGRPIRRL